MKGSGRNISLTSYDDLFSTEKTRQADAREQVLQIPLSELHPFKDHPFRVVDDDRMMETVESVKEYVTEATFDAYLWQTVENKQKFISQIMTSKSPVRSCEDMDETALSYAEIKALCAGDPRIREKMDLDVDVARLKLMKADHQSKQFRLEDQLLKYFPQEVERDTQLIAGFQRDFATIEAHPLPQEDFVGMTVGDKLIMDKEEAGKAILAACKDAAKGAPVEFGSYRQEDSQRSDCLSAAPILQAGRSHARGSKSNRL